MLCCAVLYWQLRDVELYYVALCGVAWMALRGVVWRGAWRCVGALRGGVTRPRHGVLGDGRTPIIVKLEPLALLIRRQATVPDCQLISALSCAPAASCGVHCLEKDESGTVKPRGKERGRSGCG